MFTHDEIWRGIDRLARHAQTSPSGLARRAGLDSTTFNPSKRISADGKKPRWPSTESVAKALSAANMDIHGFAALVAGEPARSLPAMDLAESGEAGRFDAAGFPDTQGWRRIPLPQGFGSADYAIELGDTALEPVFRKGSTLIISQEAEARPGDRVLVKPRAGNAEAWVLGRSDVQSVQLEPLDPARPSVHRKLADIAWIARIVWASQ